MFPARILLRVFVAMAAFALPCAAAFAQVEAEAPDHGHDAGATGHADGEHAGTDAAHAEGDHGGHAEGPITWDTDLALWSLISFLILFTVLRVFAWGPISGGLNSREARIREDIHAAEQARVQAQHMLAQHEEKLNRVQDEVRAIIAEARRDADHTKQEIISEAQKEAEATKKRAIAEIQQARDTALNDLFNTMSTQVANATEHVLSRSLTQDDQSRLIDEALAQFSAR